MLAGALRALDAPAERWSDPAMAGRFATALAEVLNTPDQHAGRQPAAGAAALRRRRTARRLRPWTRREPARWYEQLNTDPAHRVAAALGTHVVQQQQETLVAAAWDQAADLHAAGRVFGLAALGLAVADSLHRRHLVPLPPEAGLFVLAPLRARLLQAAPATGGASFAQQWAQAQLPDQALSPVVRRVTRPRGPVVRRVGRTGSIGRIDVLDRMAPISRIGRELDAARRPAHVRGRGCVAADPPEPVLGAGDPGRGRRRAPAPRVRDRADARTDPRTAPASPVPLPGRRPRRRAAHCDPC